MNDVVESTDFYSMFNYGDMFNPFPSQMCQNLNFDKKITLALSEVDIDIEKNKVVGFYSVLEKMIHEYSDSPLIKSMKVVGTQAAMSAKFLSKSSVFLNLTPGRASAAIAAVFFQKISGVLGFVGSEMVKCVSALTALVANAIAMAILGVGTGGLAIFLAVVSLGASVVDAHNKCEAYVN